jgi:hypothetical protein
VTLYVVCGTGLAADEAPRCPRGTAGVPEGVAMTRTISQRWDDTTRTISQWWDAKLRPEKQSFIRRAIIVMLAVLVLINWPGFHIG